jgi:hypothetical protein
MSTKLVQLADGTFVEVQVQEGELSQVSGKLADKVSTTLDSVAPLFSRVGDLLLGAWTSLEGRPSFEEAVVEFGISFEGEGNVFITKAKAGANLAITLTFRKPKGPETAGV